MSAEIYYILKYYDANFNRVYFKDLCYIYLNSCSQIQNHLSVVLGQRHFRWKLLATAGLYTNT